MKKIIIVTFSFVIFLLPFLLRPFEFVSAQETEEKDFEKYPLVVQDALFLAESNAQEILEFMHSAGPHYGGSVMFLLANMPPQDLQQLSSQFLWDNVYWAHQAMDSVPWAKEIPEAIFLNYVLPYAQVNERRDSWRKDFYHRFIGAAVEAGSIEKAAMLLNKKAFEELGVQYHATKRPKPDQSPYESVEAGYASCTGLSVLYADVLRAVGIPARVVTIPQWKDKSGNHTWVEVWDGQWHLVGASESEALGEAWFSHNRGNIDPAHWQHSVYAASFQKTDLRMPLVWAPDHDAVYAINVTDRYK